MCGQLRMSYELLCFVHLTQGRTGTVNQPWKLSRTSLGCWLVFVWWETLLLLLVQGADIACLLQNRTPEPKTSLTSLHGSHALNLIILCLLLLLMLYVHNSDKYLRERLIFSFIFN